jgi:hypothetical protein
MRPAAMQLQARPDHINFGRNEAVSAPGTYVIRDHMNPRECIPYRLQDILVSRVRRLINMNHEVIRRVIDGP